MFSPHRAAARVGLLVFCVAVFGRPAAAQPPPAGVVKNLAGNASIIRAGQELPVKPGHTVVEGDMVRTAADGRVGITLKDGTRLSLGGNTELRIDQFTYAPGEQRLGLSLRLLRGVAEYISGRIARLAPGAVKIETPTSVIGVRGTHVLIEVGQP